ncbi:MAG: DUF1643 domain-containing protein [Sandarakinorhabdus sp.]|nr:DUF1643 domain-containing protein [Sandarakinorhabdus sp.]
MTNAEHAVSAMHGFQYLWPVKTVTGPHWGAGAVFSPCEGYRYALWRVWNPAAPFWTFGMLNPSTADHLKLDPTLTRCANRAETGGAGGMIVWNLFAWRATDPRDMKRAADPVGEANNVIIRQLARLAAVNVAGWGAHGTHREREHRVRAMLAAEGVALHALAFTKAGQPRHPLYLGNDLKPERWAYWGKGS